MPDGARTPDLFSLAQRLLREVVAALEGAGRPVPARQYVADGPNNAVAIDTEQLVGGVGDLAPYVADQGYGVQVASGWRATLYVDLARHAPAITDPDDAPATTAIERSARGLAADAWAMVRATQSFARAAQPMVNVSLVPVGPEGGFARWVLVGQVPVL